MTQLYDDSPDLTEINPLKVTDIAIIEQIDLRCHENPMPRQELSDIFKNEEVHGLMGIRMFNNVGFALFNIQDNGNTVFVNRFSVSYLWIDRGVPEKIVEVLRTTLPNGPKPKLRMVVSEHSIGEPMFEKYIDLGFKATGLIPGHCVDYSRVYGRDVTCDGIKLELV